MITMSAEEIVSLIRMSAAVARKIAVKCPDDEVSDAIAGALEVLLEQIED